MQRTMLLVLLALVTIQAWGQGSSRSSAPPLTADQREAQKHFKVAQTAIKDGDYDVALDELQKASALDSKNSYIWYDLAVVQSKKGMDQDGLDSLNKAEHLGLPASLKDSASELHGTLAYNVEKNQKAQQAAVASNVSLSADDTLKYLQEKLVSYGLTQCGEPQTLAISPDRRKLIYSKNLSEDNICKSATYEIPVFQLQTGYFGNDPIRNWYEGNVLYGSSVNVVRPSTGDYEYHEKGSTGVAFICKLSTLCIAKNGNFDHFVIEIEFSAPDEQIVRIRKAVVHLVESLVAESQQQNQTDPFAK